LTVWENLSIWLRTNALREAACERFPLLNERRSTQAGNLSGGEQQMLALAPLLSAPPAVLIVDEPSLGLAPLIVAEVMKILTELRDRGVAVLLVEEKARDVLEIADFVAFLELGRVKWSGPRVELDDGLLAAAYFGSEVSTPARADNAPPSPEPAVPIPAPRRPPSVDSGGDRR
jgi:ABC-type branched-subunit amino acid transport system ATPase component